MLINPHFYKNKLIPLIKGIKNDTETNDKKKLVLWKVLTYPQIIHITKSVLMYIFQSHDWQSQFLADNDNDNNICKTVSEEELSSESPSVRDNFSNNMDLDPTPKSIDKYEFFKHVNNNIQNIIHIIHSSNGRLHNDKERFLQTLYTAMFDSATKKKFSIQQFSDILGISKKLLQKD